MHAKNRKGPCKWMAGLLNRVLDGRAGPLASWYVQMHTRGCTPCRIYLQDLAENRLFLRQSRVDPPEEVMRRLHQGLEAAASHLDD